MDVRFQSYPKICHLGPKLFQGGYWLVIVSPVCDQTMVDDTRIYTYTHIIEDHWESACNSLKEFGCI